jgi:hypothetical protein
MIGRVVLALAVAASALVLAGQAVAATSVKVTVTDTRVIAPTGLDSGATQFVIANTGRRPHVVAIAGPGLARPRTGRIAPGHSVTLSVRLRAGAYLLSLTDPVGLGMASTHWVQVIPAAVLTNKGGTGTTQDPTVTTGPCGVVMP